MLKFMPTLQIRHVPDSLHNTLKARAALAGQSLSEYALAALARAADEPTVDEIAARIRLRGFVEPDVPAAEVLRAERSAH